jgi:hypothetical protein
MEAIAIVMAASVVACFIVVSVVVVVPFLASAAAMNASRVAAGECRRQAGDADGPLRRLACAEPRFQVLKESLIFHEGIDAGPPPLPPPVFTKTP